MSKLTATDCIVLTKIFNPKGDWVFVLTSQEQLGTANAQLSMEKEVRYFVAIKSLNQAIEKKVVKTGTIINTGDFLLPEKLLISFPNIMLLDFGKSSISSQNLVGQQFDFINNPDGSIRWIYPQKLKYPLFLALYNNSSWRGWLFKNVFRLGFLFKVNRFLKSRSFTLWSKLPFENRLENLIPDLQAYSIFTGTIGENRKAIIVLENEQVQKQFLKIPLTIAAQKLVANETLYLTKLSAYTFPNLEIPTPKSTEPNLLISDVCPPQPLPQQGLSDLHFQGLKNLYDATLSVERLKSLQVWSALQQDLHIIETVTIANDLPIEKVHSLKQQLRQLYVQFESVDTLFTSIAHGDFTPWNCYQSSTKLHVYDWELADRLPLLYDLFHYIFQTGILVRRQTYREIKTEIELMVAHQTVQDLLINQSAIDLYYHFYLLRNITYYLSRYVRQPVLHEQVFWQLATWEKALEQYANHSNQMEINPL